jgi:excisionase family DNA binding protein
LLDPIPRVVSSTGLSRAYVYELIRTGQLEAVKIGKRRLVVHESVVAFVERARAQSA